MTDAALVEENARLRARLAETGASLAEAQEAQRRLEGIVRELRREKFGRASEKLDPEQFNLPLEDVEIARGVLEAAQEKARRALTGATDDTERPPKRTRGHLPKHLPGIERVIEPESILCPCGRGEMAKIGEDVSERLDIVPAQLRVLVTRRPRYACRRCSGAVVQAHAPEHVVPGGLPTEALIAVRHRARTDGATMAHHRLQVRRPPAVSVIGRVWSMAMTVQRAGPYFCPWSACRHKMRTVEVGMLLYSTSASIRPWANPS
jgi:transposase